MLIAFHFIILDFVSNASEKNNENFILLVIFRFFDLFLHIYFWICTFSFCTMPEDKSKEVKSQNSIPQSTPNNSNNAEVEKGKNAPTPYVPNHAERYTAANSTLPRTVSTISCGYQNELVVDNSKITENIKEEIRGKVGMIKGKFDQKPLPPAVPKKRAPTLMRTPSVRDSVVENEDEYMEFDD